MSDLQPGPAGWQQQLYSVIFESDTTPGKAFDVLLLVLIVASVVAVCLESMPTFQATHGSALRVFEWVFTISFSLEFLLRVVMLKNPMRYLFSFFGVVDLLAVLPTYVGLLYPESRYLTVVRVLRLLRVFRIFKLHHYISESSALTAAMVASRRKIAVFVFFVLNAVIVIGSVMYVVEGPEHGFTSIPVSIYWAIVTLTTVGYGDIAPGTPLGQLLACVVMILGYGVIAVPTGIVTVELSQGAHARRLVALCASCSRGGHEEDARHCKYCGAALQNFTEGPQKP
jgi:voltage-gated potassium channel